MLVLKICKWYQTVRLVMTRRLVSSVTFLCQIIKLTYLVHYVPCYLLWHLVTSILTWPKFVFTKVVGLSTNYQTPFAVCRYYLCFSRSEGGEGEKARARLRAFQSPPGIGLNWTPMVLLLISSISWEENENERTQLKDIVVFAWTIVWCHYPEWL